MAQKCYVVGHINPDNDSICSAVAYAYLKNESAKNAIDEGKEIDYYYEPVRLGPMPPETQWIFDKYKIPYPRAVRHVYGRVRDVMSRNPICVREDETVALAGRRMRQNHVKSLVVIDKNENYRGLVTTRMIADRYISATDLLGKDNDMTAVSLSLLKSLEESVSDMMETEVLELDDEDLLKDAAGELMQSKLREAVVLEDVDGGVDGQNGSNDSSGAKKCIGILTRSDVAKQLHKNVILVDHNESAQAAQGIREARILEIIDHHRIADLSTLNPIKFMNLPVGSTASIVTSEFINYKHRKIDIPKPIAAALLSAVMTDTVILNSPTTTEFDRKMAKYLADIVGVEIEKFGYDVFSCRGDDSELDIKDLVESDSKEFQLGDQRVLIAQHETIDIANTMKREDEIRERLHQIRTSKDYEFVLLLVTDIIKQGSLFVADGNIEILNRIFDIECHGEGGTWMPGIVSRKLQVAPKILGA